MKKKTLRFVMGVVVGFLMANGFLCPVQAKLSEEEAYYYGVNKIYFYDPHGNNKCVDGGAKNTKEVDPAEVYISGDDNASGIMGTLMNNGYSKGAAAAIIGNLYAESGLNPRVLQGGTVVSDDFRAWDGGKTYSGGFGLVQWDHESRVEALQNYADNRGLGVASIQAQVGFMIEELASYGYGPDVLNSMSLEDAVHGIWRNYENPATEDYEARLGFARQFLGVEPGSLPESVKTETGEVVNCEPEDGYFNGDYEGVGTPVEVDGIVSFLQCDPTWADLNYGLGGVNGSDGNTICAAGCGPTSFASIAATMGLDVNPVKTADAAGRAGMYVYGVGSSWSITRVLAEEFGLNYESLESYSVDYINSVLRSGGMIHVAGSGSMPYTSGGHYIAIVGIADSGEWIVTDSGHTAEYAVATYDPGQIVAGMNVGSAGIVRR